MKKPEALKSPDYEYQADHPPVSHVCQMKLLQFFQ
jgi:hypothetical protein